MRPTAPGTYVFDRTRTDEEERLEAQSGIVDPFTERLFLDAGLGSGMRVLELGSGAGDVAMLAARIVGAQGEVVGIEGSSIAIHTARRRAAEAGLENASFFQGDLRELEAVIDPDVPPFDARGSVGVAVHAGSGRCAPCSCRPCASRWPRVFPGVRSQHLRLPEHPALGASPRVGAGGPQPRGCRNAHGPPPLSDVPGADLPAPELRLEAGIGGGERAPAFIWADLVRSVIPTLEQAGIATEAEIDPDTLADRLMDETASSDGVVITIILVGAWARTPA